MTGRNDLRISAAGVLLAGVVLVMGLAPSTVTAQDMDARWLPWLGCWEAVEGGEDAPLLCVRPATEGSGVDFVTWSQGEVTATETILADGIQRNAEREECSGVERAEFSDDGDRVYLNSQYVCDGDIQRKASGILAMVNPMEWVDIKAVDGSPWVLRYRLARASKVQEAGLEDVGASRAADVKAARISASSRLTAEDIIETVGKVDGKAVEALIVERGDPFSVDADLLVRLDDAGVAEGVIDLVVAISYPDRFAVKAGAQPMEEYAADENQPRRSIYMAGGYYDPWYFGYGYPFGYSRYGYGYGYGGYYSPYYYGNYGYYGYQYSPIIVTTRTNPVSSMIKGQGYTRRGTSSVGYTGRTAVPRSGASGGGASASGGGSSAGRSAKPRSGGGGVSSGASTGSSSSKVRTAKPRSGGGGGG